LGRTPPKVPRVDLGPRAYEVWPGGAVRVIRFYVGLRLCREKSRYVFRRPYEVYDMDTGRVAARTTGYASKQEAIRVARRYRDRYGAYAKVPF
jgi:hypothetical protein